MLLAFSRVRGFYLQNMKSRSFSLSYLIILFLYIFDTGPEGQELEG
jgi:hypothetical protein